MTARTLRRPAASTAGIPGAPWITGVGTAVSRRVRSVVLDRAIERRHLSLPPVGPDGAIVAEAQGELLAKHRRPAVDLGGRALRSCLRDAGLDLADADYLSGDRTLRRAAAAP